ncbi:hypothetical protein [Micromonospora sp. NPDC005299]|uniref:hypothetical protein n=1 Tax=Micromonospora sp. NPDC005299 TaxID=3364231 RepID=UPI00369CB419
MGSLSRRAELDALVGEATVDAYDADEQLSGLFTMIEDNLAVPFTTQVLGVEVTVRGLICATAQCSRSAIEVESVRRSGFWIFPCRSRHRPAQRGSRRTGTGRAGDPYGGGGRR